MAKATAMPAPRPIWAERPAPAVTTGGVAPVDEAAGTSEAVGTVSIVVGAGWAGTVPMTVPVGATTVPETV